MSERLTSRGRSHPGLLPLANFRFDVSRLLPAISSQSDVAAARRALQGKLLPIRAISWAQAIRDVSRIAWTKLMARVGEEFPLACPNCGGDIRLIAFITEPGPIRKILTHLGEPLEPPPVSPARGPPTDWGELVQIHDDRDVFQASPDEASVIDIHSL